MIKSGQAYHAAITGDARRVLLRAVIDIISPDIVFGAGETSGQIPWSKPEQLHDKVFGNPTKYATLERDRWALDGTWDLLPDDPAQTAGQMGYIGNVLSGADKAFETLADTAEAGADASHAIMTTDTHPKEIALEFAVGGKAVRIGAIAKGSGMIHPNMATMLLFMTTDAKVAPAALQKALSTVVPATFNQISVDGDTSTNDTVLLLASGLSGAEIAEGTPDYDTFVAALTEVAEHLSRELAGDGEGATKLLECTVTGAPDLATARAVSKSVIHSTLFKAAMFGADANWGRVLCAIGYTPGDFDISKTSVRLKSKAGEVFVCENAAYHPYSEDEAAVVLKEDEIDILVDLGSGDATAKAWGCDLTYDYVKINGDYRT